MGNTVEDMPDIDQRNDDDDVSEGALVVTLTHRKNSYRFEFPDDATVTDLFAEIEASLDIPVSNQKILVPKGPLLKMPFKDPDMSLQTLQHKPLMLLGCGAAEVQAIQSMADKVARRNAARMAMRNRPAARRRAPVSQDDLQYTFMQVKPLQGLPRPERSQVLLMRLKSDAGIRAAMKKHKFTVALLTEMEPLSHTQSTHEGTSRILGLNRNKGEVIELRLRTDAYDGYRDYRTIRNTLCHELAHNVHSEHDRDFWDLCRQIEREVDAADWRAGGHTVSGESSRYATASTASDQDDHQDGGGWTGGEFVLGGVRGQPSQARSELSGMSRRDVLAQAAQERQKRESCEEAKAVEAAEKGWRPCQRQSREDTPPPAPE